MEDNIINLLDLEDEQSIEIPEELPLMPMRDIIVFPSMIVPFLVGRESSVKAINEALSADRLIFLVTQKDPTEEDPSEKGLYQTGVVALIMRTLQLPDGRLKILGQALIKGTILEFMQKKPFFRIRVNLLREKEPTKISVKTEALIRNIKDQAEKLFDLKGIFTPEMGAVLNSVKGPGRLADIVASNLNLMLPEAQGLLEMKNPLTRLKKINSLLTRELEVSSVQAKIQSKAKEEMTKTQREYFLREELRAIKQELGEIDERSEDLAELRNKVQKAKMPKEAEKEALKQIQRLDSMHPESAEASIVRTYIDWLVELPWSVHTKDRLDVRRAQKVLDEEHYDLKKVKDRIIEYIAVRRLNPSAKCPILCFVGPPGVGKTSLGRSVARALNKKFVRISLGGVRDEAEIRGHRRTYIGALPGRIIQGLKRAGNNNPVFMIDEVDKVGADFRGDPAAALLEVLDPEQNYSFTDHYLDLPFDLSKVLFILTANVIDTIPSALLDRLEVIYLSGYTREEKEAIAEKYLIPRQLKGHGLSKKVLNISAGSLSQIISDYTQEAGLRELERQIGAICRKVARRIAERENGPFKVTKANIQHYLGIPRFQTELTKEESQVGVATGLAWTPFGGEVLRVEVSLMKGKGKLILTGLMGEVMKESAQAALSYTRSRAERLGIDPKSFEERDIHIHVPAGAIPKDGPSAGITLTTALVSALIERPVDRDVTMTGEITLRGRVLPIGGLKEKSLAALRADIPIIIIPEQNLVDLEEMPANVRRQIEFRPVRNMDEVLEIALGPIPWRDTE
ncbi:MAG: endopeptidase La [Nitrospiraceae bacterium]|nr:endopeptidase La [Nitrospiraceae bacterium]